MRVTRYLLCASLLFATLFASARDDDRDDATEARPTSVRIRAILVAASDEKGETDPRLAPYATNLKRSLRFESFKHAGEGTANVPMPGGNKLSLGRGQRLELEAAYYGKDQYWVRVVWYEGSREFMNTVLILRRGVPALLGGLGGKGDETYATIVIAG